MSDKESDKLGRILALVLRHAPEKFDVEMDINGWVSVLGLCDGIKAQRRDFHWLKPWHFEAVTVTEEKGRYEVEGERIRATYGHSIEIEIDLPTDEIPEVLFYPVSLEEVDDIIKLGIKGGDRRHVHLSKTVAKAYEAGSVRIKGPSIVEVDTVRAIADGISIFRAGKLVCLAEEIPPQYLYKVSSDDPELIEVLENLEEE
jgi:putative RNA 2'-phosphotransferase